MAVFEIIDSNGYTESVDFFYVPMDLQSKQNKGYAFINFVDAKIAAEFKERFDGARFGAALGERDRRSCKAVQVWRASAQGVFANLLTLTHANWTKEEHMPLVRVDGRLTHLSPLAMRELLRTEELNSVLSQELDLHLQTVDLRR